MNSKTQFDTDREILDWKNSLLSSGNFTDENVTELESHLKDEIDNIHSTELNVEEKFLIAQKRIGYEDTLNAAFNPKGKLGFQKLSWGLQAILFLFLFKEMTILFTYFSGDLILINDLVKTVPNFILAIIFQALAVTILVMIFRKTMRLNNKYKDSLRPNIFVLSSLLITFLVRVGYFMLVGSPAAMMESMTVIQTMSFIPPVLTVVLMIFITMNEKRRKTMGKVISS